MSADPRILPVGGGLPPMLTPAEVAEREVRRTARRDGKAGGKAKMSR